jgi:hypothetical protein
VKTYRRRGFGKSNLGRYDWVKCSKHAQSFPHGSQCVMCRREQEEAGRGDRETAPQTDETKSVA